MTSVEKAARLITDNWFLGISFCVWKRIPRTDN